VSRSCLTLNLDSKLIYHLLFASSDLYLILTQYHLYNTRNLQPRASVVARLLLRDVIDQGHTRAMLPYTLQLPGQKSTLSFPSDNIYAVVLS
jgi:hypothetical protein